MFVDLGAEKVIAAEKEDKKIAVEVKSFLSPSEVQDLQDALGQYILYQDILEYREPERMLYLAVRKSVFFELFEEPIGKLVLEKHRLRLLVFDPTTQEITQWIPEL